MGPIYTQANTALGGKASGNRFHTAEGGRKPERKRKKTGEATVGPRLSAEGGRLPPASRGPRAQGRGEGALYLLSHRDPPRGSGHGSEPPGQTQLGPQRSRPFWGPTDSGHYPPLTRATGQPKPAPAAPSPRSQQAPRPHIRKPSAHRGALGQHWGCAVFTTYQLLGDWVDPGASANSPRGVCSPARPGGATGWAGLATGAPDKCGRPILGLCPGPQTQPHMGKPQGL